MAGKKKKTQTTTQATVEVVLQDKLKQSEADFYQMIEAMPQMVWITRPDGYHEFYNRHWYTYTGTSFEDTKGEGWNEMFHPEDRKRAWKVWQHSLRTGDPYQIEYRLKYAKTNEWRWVLGRALPIRNEKGEITRWVGTCTDIDEQKRTTQNMQFLSEASKLLSSSLDYKKTLTNIAKLSVPEICDWCSIQMETSNGIEQLAIAHKDPKKVKWAKELNRKDPPDPDAKTGVPQVLRTGKPEFYPEITDAMLVAAAKNEEQLTLIRKLGFSSAMIVPIIVDHNAIGAISFVAAESDKHYTKYDLAMAEELASRASFAIQNASLYKTSQEELQHRKQLATELLAAKEYLEDRVSERTKILKNLNLELQRSNRELEDFAYVASHDLQEPLRKIQAFGNLLGEEYADKLGEGKLYIERMQHAAGRMRALIDDLLAFSRVTTRGQEKVAVDLNKIIENTLSDMEIIVEEMKAKITIDILPTVEADAMQMRQLFQNLLSNAIKFHKPKISPVITISCKETADDDSQVPMCTIEVKDNGIGFDQKYSERIFTVFQRLHGKEDYEGTGVGLAVVRKIVERHNGTIMVQSAPGKGTTFWITLPVYKKGGARHS